MKERIREVSAVRTISTLGIITYHGSAILISDISNIPNDFFNRMVVSGWGNIFVTVFFVLSGFCIIYNNNQLTKYNLWEFYKKRFLSVFVSFYLVWFFIYFKNVIITKKFFYAGRPASILLSLVGADGYWGGSYYSIGEWFLGALLICYLVYPILLWAYNKNIWISSVVILILYNIGIHYQIGYWDISFRGIFTCVLSFWIGMVLSRYREKMVHSILLLACAADVFWHLYTGKVTSMDITTLSVALGVMCFIILLILGKKMTEWKGLFSVVEFLSGISFQMFLLHHCIIQKYGQVLNKFEIYPTGFSKWIVFGIVLLTIIFLAFLLKQVNDKIVSRIKK